MATTLEFDLEALLAPIPGDHPTGVDLRNDESSRNPWYSILGHRGDARRAERELETWDSDFATSNGISPPEPLNDWQNLLDEASEALQQWSKDLELVAYMIEAWVRTEGFAGMLKGWKLAHGLMERYWEDVYPRPEDKDPGATVLHLAQLNGLGGGGVLLEPLRRIPITDGRGGETYALWQYIEAKTLEALSPDAKAKKIERGALTLEQVQKSANATSADFYLAARSDIEQTMEVLGEIDRFLEDRLPTDFRPSFNAIREQLDDVVRALNVIAPLPTTAADAGPGEAGVGGNGSVVSGAIVGGMTLGAVASREEAFKQLILIADFFEKTEPLSLLAEQIRKVVRLGRMSPLEYFSELIEDDSIRQQMFKMVGIKPPEE